MKQLTALLLLLSLFCFTGCSKEKRSGKAGIKMQDFVINISNYARLQDPDFIIIPQNGIELAYNNVNPEEGFNENYLEAIDGVGVEELFFNEGYTLDNSQLSMLHQIQARKKVMVSDFIADNNLESISYNLNAENNFICFVRKANNYDYLYIPDLIFNENADDITELSQAKNYLYLISTNNYTTKQDFLNDVKATNYDVVIMDLFFDQSSFTSSEIAQLRFKENGGKRLVISYVSIGSAEKYRYYWKNSWGQHHPLWIKRKYDGYPDEFWVKFWKKDWQDIIYGNADSYIKKITDAGFDGAYLDNLEAYYFLYYKD